MSSVLEITVSVICCVLICGLSTIGNTVVIFVFIRRKDILTISNYFFASLSFGNLIVGLFYPLQCLVDLGVVSSKTVCLPFLYSLLVLAYVVIWSLLALTVERYLTITCPLTACRVLSEKRAVVVIILIYSFGVICGVVIPVLLSISAPSDENNNSCRFIDLVPSSFYRIFLLGNRLVSVAVFIGTYGSIFVVMRKHMRAIAVQIRPTPQLPTSTEQTNEDSISTIGVRHETGRWKRQVRPTILLFVVVLYHCLSSIPQFFVVDNVDERSFMVLTVTHFVMYSSSAINPLLYGISNRQFRRALASVFSQ